MQRVFRSILLLLSVTFAVPSWAEFNPLNQVTTLVGASTWLSPGVGLDLLASPNKYLRTSWSGSVRVEIPIYKYLNSGFQFTTTILNGSEGLDRQLVPLIELGSFFKGQVPFEFAGGYVAPYAAIPFGVSSFMIQQLNDGTSLFQDTTATATVTHSLVGIGFGPTGGLFGGVDYFPIPEIGVFVEGGWRAALIATRLRETTDVGPPGNHNTVARDSWDFYNYWISGASISFGVKFNF